MKSLLIKGIISFAILVSLGACGGRSARYGEGAPDWVVKGMGTFIDKDQKAFYGVGAITGVNDKGLARKTADNRARAKISQMFEAYSAALVREYTRTPTEDDFSQTSEDPDIEQTLKAYVAMTLSGVIILDHWTDRSDGVYYTLARLNLKQFRENISEATALNEEVKTFVKENAEKVFDRLEREEAKHR